MDITSSSFSPEKSRILTDNLRTELFKTKLYRIVERSALQQALADPKTTWTGEDQVFETFKTIASRLITFSKSSVPILASDSSDDPDKRLAEAWTFLGARGADLDYLVTHHVQTEEYVGLRQFDIAFLPADYAQLKRQGTDVSIVMAFLQGGVSYDLAKKAIGLGVVRLDRWREGFAPKGYSFAQYLEAYQNGLLSPEDYKQYRDTFRKDFLVLGAGGVADAFPIATAYVKFPLSLVGWERFWTPNLRQNFKLSTIAGVYGMWLILPVPFVAMNAYFGSYPYYFKLGLGGHAELIIGGHTGISAIAGIELLERIELDTFWILAGTQPSVDYTVWTIKLGDPGYVDLKFPFIGAFFTYKM
jgi:hypothetical protein